MSGTERVTTERSVWRPWGGLPLPLKDRDTWEEVTLHDQLARSCCLRRGSVCYRVLLRRRATLELTPSRRFLPKFDSTRAMRPQKIHWYVICLGLASSAAMALAWTTHQPYPGTWAVVVFLTLGMLLHFSASQIGRASCRE